MSNTVIRVENLSKQYRLGALNHGTLYRDLQSRWARFRSKEDPNSKLDVFHQGQSGQDGDIFWALRDLSFDVTQGDKLGIIGKNGAGKSTLLKLISRITTPTSGQIKLKGRVASLLEVGTGFHPELTGRENTYLNGTILGMSKKEIDRKFDEIIMFAEIEKFVDTPVKRYSSGMYVRLAFAVAAHLEPEILVVDEVLAVGDAQFQKKCLKKMEEVGREGRTVLFVSHQMDMVRNLCNRCILLKDGGLFCEGSTDKVIDAYGQSFMRGESSAVFEEKPEPSLRLQIVRGRVTNEKGELRENFDVFDRIIFEFEYMVHDELEDVILNFELKRNDVTLFLSFDTDTDENKHGVRRPGLYRSHIELPRPLLKSGRYTITTNTGVAHGSTYQRLENVLMFDVELHSRPSSLLSYADFRPGMIALPVYWKTERIEEY